MSLEGAWVLLYAVFDFGIVDAGIFGRTSQGVAALGSGFVHGFALINVDETDGV